MEEAKPLLLKKAQKAHNGRTGRGGKGGGGCVRGFEAKPVLKECARVKKSAAASAQPTPPRPHSLGETGAKPDAKELKKDSSICLRSP